MARRLPCVGDPKHPFVWVWAFPKERRTPKVTVLGWLPVVQSVRQLSLGHTHPGGYLLRVQRPTSRGVPHAHHRSRCHAGLSPRAASVLSQWFAEDAPGAAPGLPAGATRKQIGHLCPRGTASRQDAPSGNCFSNYCDRPLAGARRPPLLEILGPLT